MSIEIIKDGILFRVAISVAGRRCVALIDSGASQSYISPEIVTLCELQCSPYFDTPRIGRWF